MIFRNFYQIYIEIDDHLLSSIQDVSERLKQLFTYWWHEDNINSKVFKIKYQLIYYVDEITLSLIFRAKPSNQFDVLASVIWKNIFPTNAVNILLNIGNFGEMLPTLRFVYFQLFNNSRIVWTPIPFEIHWSIVNSKWRTDRILLNMWPGLLSGTGRR